MQVKTNTNGFIAGTMRRAGEAFELEAAEARKLIDEGAVVEVDERGLPVRGKQTTSAAKAETATAPRTTRKAKDG
jgi:hypothetical protein